jgi:methionine sulfoxide reductase heme-binding subunit
MYMAENHQNQVIAQRRITRRLLSHHLPIALTSAMLIWLFFQTINSPDLKFRLSMATAYTSLILLGGTLITGAINILRSRPNPISTDLRRDLGIWAAIMGVAHTIVGLNVHMGGKFWLYFLSPADEDQLLPIRLDPFGLANHTGLLAVIILVLLAAISNDLAIRWLGSKRWKSFQQYNYALYVLVILHAVAYQLTEKRQMPYPLILGMLITLVLIIQGVGFQRRKQQLAAKTQPPDI